MFQLKVGWVFLGWVWLVQTQVDTNSIFTKCTDVCVPCCDGEPGRYTVGHASAEGNEFLHM